MSRSGADKAVILTKVRIHEHRANPVFQLRVHGSLIKSGTTNWGKESGFTLIEMLVALAIFSLAALALLRLGGATAGNAARLDMQAMAQVVARNIAVETLTDPGPPAFGEQGGVTVNGGRRWRWSRVTARSPEARISQIEIRVDPEAGGAGGARLTIFRRAPR